MPFVSGRLLRAQPAILRFGEALAAGAAGALGAFILPGKGWSYHGIPFYGLSLLVAIVMISATEVPVMGERAGSPGRIRWRVAALATITVLFTVREVRGLWVYHQPPGETRMLVRTNSDLGNQVLLIDPGVQPAFPSILQEGRSVCGSFLAAFPILSSLEGMREGRRPAELRDYLAVVKEDLRKCEPELVLVRRACHGCGGVMLDEVLDRIGILEELLPAYEQVGADSRYFRVYRRVPGG